MEIWRDTNIGGKLFEQQLLTSKKRNSAKENNCLYEDSRIGKWRKSFMQYEMQVGKPNEEMYKFVGRGDSSAADINTLMHRAV